MNWLILSLLGAFFLSVSDIVAKDILKKNNPLEFTLILYVIDFIAFSPFLFTINFSNMLTSTFILIMLRGIVISLGIYTFATALKKSDISIVAPMMNLSILILLILSFIFLGETLTINQYLGAMLLMAGSYILNIKHHTGVLYPFKEMFKSPGSIYILFTLFLFSAGIIFEKKVFSSTNITTMQFLSLSVACSLTILTIIFTVNKNSFRHLYQTAKKYGSFAIIFAGLDFISAFFHLKAVAIPTAKVSLIIPIRRLSTLMDVIVGGQMFHESKLILKTLASLTMIIGVFIIMI